MTEQLYELSEQQKINEAVVVTEVQHATTTDVVRPNQLTAKASTMLLILRDLALNGERQSRASLAKQISEQYPEGSPDVDHDTDVAVLVGPKLYTKLVEGTFVRLGLTVEEIEYVAPVRPDRPNAVRARGTSSKQPRQCECGCGGMTGGGRFLPGHDAKMKGRLIKDVDDRVSEESANILVTNNWWTQETADLRLEKARIKAAGRAAEEEAAMTAHGTEIG